MKIQKAKTLARNLMDEFGLSDWSINLDNAKTRLGQCRCSRKVISLSKPITKLNSQECVEDTIRHEIAHALDYLDRGKSDHSYKWKAWAEKVGADPTRTAKNKDVKTPTAPYYMYCPECGTYSDRWRKAKKDAIYTCKCTGSKTAAINNVSLETKRKIEAGKIAWQQLPQAEILEGVLSKYGRMDMMPSGYELEPGQAELF